MSLPFSSQLPNVITISLTYERKKNIYRTFFATTNFQLQIMYSKAELLQLKPHPFICMRNFILIKMSEIEKTKPTFIILVLKIEY